MHGGTCSCWGVIVPPGLRPCGCLGLGSYRSEQATTSWFLKPDPLALQNRNCVKCRSSNGVLQSSSKPLMENVFILAGASTCSGTVAGPWGNVFNIQGSLDLPPSILSGSMCVCVCLHFHTSFPCGHWPWSWEAVESNVTHSELKPQC